MLKCQWNTTSFQSVHLFTVYTISETSQDSADGVAPQGCVLNACTKGVHVMLSTLLSYAATSKQEPDPEDCLQPNSSMQFPVVTMQEKMDFKASHTPNLKNHNAAETELHTNSFWCENQKAKVSIHIAIYYQRLLVQDRSQLNWRFFGQGLTSILTTGMTWWVHLWVGWPETKATALWMFYPYCLWMTVRWWFNTNVRWVWRFKTRQRQLLVLHHVSHCIIAIHSSPVARFFPPWQRNHCPMHPGINASCTRVPQTGCFSWDSPHCEPFLFACGFMLGPLKDLLKKAGSNRRTQNATMCCRHVMCGEDHVGVTRRSC